ncbi:hypothetical protein [Neisseria sp.]|uniref:hypothetical protein n=1 Tax=Neisseria sp. TaxID=192066 RepID=UPI00359FB430
MAIVIPAQAGIQNGGLSVSLENNHGAATVWIPACAGMTAGNISSRHTVAIHHS